MSEASINLRVYSIVFILDSIQVLLCGVIKGLGLQDQAQNYAMFSFFLISLPASYLFSLTFEYGINGLWYGFSIGLFVLILFYLKLILFSNWNHIVIEIQ